ncbi:MAG: hypothetical protein HZA54_04705 [Planctomycetes bacterium]|nr:hypothetical protein [Planctomycetota bacterium]
MADPGRKCPHCSKLNPAGLVHCNACGGILPAEAPAERAAPAAATSPAGMLFFAGFVIAFLGAAWWVDNRRATVDAAAAAAAAGADAAGPRRSAYEERLAADAERVRQGIMESLKGLPAPPGAWEGANGDFEGMINAEMRRSVNRQLSPAEEQQIRKMVKSVVGGMNAEQLSGEARNFGGGR